MNQYYNPQDISLIREQQGSNRRYQGCRGQAKFLSCTGSNKDSSNFRQPVQEPGAPPAAACKPGHAAN